MISWKVLLISLCVLAVLLCVLFVPAVLRARECAKTSVCVSNLKQIGLALKMYSQDYKDRYPQHLNQLYPTYVSSRKSFICPGQRPTVTEQQITGDFEQCYTYVPGLTDKDDPSRLLAYDREGNHKYHRHAPGPHVLFVDGHVKRISDDIWPQVKAAGRDITAQ